MKLRLISCLLVVSTLLSCDNAPNSHKKAENTSANIVKQDEMFEIFKEGFLSEYWSQNPTYGLYVGYYKHDSQMEILDKVSYDKNNAFADKILKQLNDFDIAKLSALNAADLALIRNQIEAGVWYQDVFKTYEWDPSIYNVAGAFGLILNTDYKPLDQRLRTISTRLDYVPIYYNAAITNLTHPTLEHTELAIQQNLGALSVFNLSIPEKLKDSGLTLSEKEDINLKLKTAATAINDYVVWLKAKRDQIKDSGAKDFRIGAELYEAKFKFDIVSNYSAKQLFELAIESKTTLHQEMIKITTQLWPKYFPTEAMPSVPLVAVKKMIDLLSQKHIGREDFVPEIKRQMPIIEQYIIQNDLLDMDASRPLVVRETPEYQRGIAGASVNAPGPYDATANTYYNVTPLDDYTEDQAESYLREYNHWILQILNIHEAMPGHYTQLMHANKSPSKIKSIFGNGAMIEGWAVYSERMMLESGYGNNEPELWLMYSKWNLRVVVNTILDYSVQVLGLSKDEAMSLLMNEAFQEKTEAEGKWRRATLSQVQLTSYYNGFAEIYAFREELKGKMGDKFNLKNFHNQFLSYGNSPVPVIRELMLKELNL